MKDPVPSPALNLIQPGPGRSPGQATAAVEAFLLRPGLHRFSDGERMYLSRALAGEFAATGDDYFFLFSVGGRYVSHAWYSVSRRTPEVGVLGYVLTDPEWRGRGLSRKLCAVLFQHFEVNGGRAMYLGTTNPVARRIYLENGFKSYSGNVMRRLIAGMDEAGFEGRYFAPSPELSLRPAEWGDLAGATVLYCQLDAWITRDFTEGVFLPPGGQLRRSLSVYVALMARGEIPGNSMQVLQTASKSIVGCLSSLASPARETTVLEFMVHPSFTEQAVPLLRSRLDRGISCSCYAAAQDTPRVAMLRALDFKITADQSERDGLNLTRFQSSDRI